MKIFSIIMLLLLSACSDLSGIEERVVGYWEWKLINGGVSESGFLDLRSDRSYAFQIDHKSAAELLSEKFSHSELSYWRIKEGKVCTASEWSGDSIFLKPEISQEKCRWNIEVASDGKLYLEMDSEFINSKVNLTRSAKIR